MSHMRDLNPMNRRALASRLALVCLVLAALGCGGTGGSTGDTTPRASSSSGGSSPRETDAPASTGSAASSGSTGPSVASVTASSSSPYAAQYGDARALETLTGRASYYSDRLAGRSTASGEPYRTTEFTAASRDLRFGTILRVTRVDTGAVTYARVNDRGPFGDRRRVIDLSRAAAEELGMIRAGVVDVRVEIVHRPDR